MRYYVVFAQAPLGEITVLDFSDALTRALYVISLTHLGVDVLQTYERSLPPC